MRLMGITMLVKPLALITQILIARYFGASAMLDAYTFTLFLVTFLGFTLSGVYSSVVIPQMTRIKSTRPASEVASYQNAVTLLFFVPVALLVLIFLVRGEQVIDLVGANLPAETKQFSYKMLRILAVPSFVFCLVKISSALLNLNKIFKIPAAMLPLHSVFFFVAVASLASRIGIWALPIGWTVSHVLQAIILGFHVLRRKVVEWVRPSLTRKDSKVLWGLCWTVLIAQAMLMINTFVDKWFATGLPVGSISYINYSRVLINFGHQIFSMSLIVVMFTKMSELLASNKERECDTYLHHNLVRVSNLVVPASLALFVASPEIVRALYQRGAFNAYDSVQTSGTLAMYLLGLPAMVLNGIVARLYHSMQKVKHRIWLTLQYLLTNVIGNIFLVKILATMGLAISSTIAINLHLLLSLVWIQYFGTGLRPGRYLKIIGVSYLMALVTYLVYFLTGTGELIESHFGLESLGQAFVAGGLKIVVILALYGVQVLGFLFWSRRSNG